jgi:Na+-driven multidrug efflux pump
MGINLLLLGMGRWRALYRRGWSPLPGTIRQIFTIGWPAAMLQIAWNAGTIVLYNLLGRLGEASITALAAIANGLRIEALIFLPAFALNMSASVRVGQNLGAGTPERAARAGWQPAPAGMGFLTALAVLVFIWAKELAALVAKEPRCLGRDSPLPEDQHDQPAFIALSLSLSGGLQGAGDTRGTMWVIVIAVWLIRLPLAWLLALGLGWGAPGVWGAMCVSMIGQGLMMAARFRGGKWKAMKLT